MQTSLIDRQLVAWHTLITFVLISIGFSSCTATFATLEAGPSQDSGYCGTAQISYKKTRFYKVASRVISVGVGAGVGYGVLQVQPRQDRYFFPVVLGGLAATFSINILNIGFLNPIKFKKTKVPIGPDALERWRKEYNRSVPPSRNVIEIAETSSNPRYPHFYTTQSSLLEHARKLKFRQKELDDIASSLAILKNKGDFIADSILTDMPKQYFVTDQWETEFYRNLNPIWKAAVESNLTLLGTAPKTFGIYQNRPISVYQPGRLYALGSLKNSNLIGWTYLYAPVYKNIRGFTTVYNNEDIQEVKKAMLEAIKDEEDNFEPSKRLVSEGYKLNRIELTEFVGRPDTINPRFTGGFICQGKIVYATPQGIEQDLTIKYYNQDFFAGDGTWLINNKRNKAIPERVILPDPRREGLTNYYGLFGKKGEPQFIHAHLMYIKNAYTIDEVCRTEYNETKDYTGQVTRTTTDITTPRHIEKYYFLRRRNIKDSWKEVETQTLEELRPCSTPYWMNATKKERYETLSETYRDMYDEVSKKYPTYEDDPYIAAYLKAQAKEDSIYKVAYNAYLAKISMKVCKKKREVLLERLRQTSEFPPVPSLSYAGIWFNTANNLIYCLGQQKGMIIDASDKSLALDKDLWLAYKTCIVRFDGKVVHLQPGFKLHDFEEGQLTLIPSDLLSNRNWVRIH